MKVVSLYPNRAEAEMAKGFLDSANIPSFVSIDDEGGVHPALGAMRGAKLMVPEEFFESAKEIMDAIDGAPPLLEVVDPEDS
jgi:hypothetical protein